MPLLSKISIIQILSFFILAKCKFFDFCLYDEMLEALNFLTFDMFMDLCQNVNFPKLCPFWKDA